MAEVNAHAVTPSGLTASVRTASAVSYDGMGLTSAMFVSVLMSFAKITADLKSISLSAHLPSCFCLRATYMCECVFLRPCERDTFLMGSGFLHGDIWWREFEDSPHALLCCSVSSGWLGHGFSLRLFFSSRFVFMKWGWGSKSRLHLVKNYGTLNGPFLSTSPPPPSVKWSIR